MSTDRTENYQLHVWGAEDEESLAEINENFAAIDTAIMERCRMVGGAYSGDGTKNQLIALGFTPKAVIVNNALGLTANGQLHGGIALPGHPANMGGTPMGLEVVTGGFRVSTSISNLLNENGRNYYYIAME